MVARHLSHSGDYIAMDCASIVVHRASTSSSQELLGQSLSNLVCSICRAWRQEIVHFMTPLPPQGEAILWFKV